MISKKELAAAAVQIAKQIAESLGGPTSSSAAMGRYVGAQGAEAREENERSKLQYWGHSAATHHKLAATDWSVRAGGMESVLSKLSLLEQWRIWLAIWSASEIFEVKGIALGALSAARFASLRKERAADLFALAGDIDNWALSDMLSALLAAILEENRTHLPRYVTWNRSKNPWLRRQSIVGLYSYARLRKSHLPARIALGLVAPLLEDPHFYVQRAVGWTLREIDRVDPVLQRAFVRKHLRQIGGVAWFATSELYPEALKKELLLARKTARKSGKVSRQG